MSDKKNDPGTGRYWNRRNNPPKVVRRLGTFDSRKPGQSPKEMKKLLEDADKTLKSTKMKPETQGSTETGKLQAKAIISSNKPESEKVRNPLTVHDRSTGGPRSSHVKYLTQKHYKSDVGQRIGISNVDYPTRTGVIGSYLVRSQNPMLRKSATDKVKDRVSLNKGLSEFRDNQLYRRIDKDNTKSIKEANRKKPIQGTFRTQGKQDLLEGKPRKTTVSARAGAGLGWLKRKYLRYGASQWRKSKTH
tara:strand:- start:53 stop:793 length:741 start_codon:yes stop_codon:yes gene_type:complete